MLDKGQPDSIFAPGHLHGHKETAPIKPWWGNQQRPFRLVSLIVDMRIGAIPQSSKYSAETFMVLLRIKVLWNELLDPLGKSRPRFPSKQMCPDAKQFPGETRGDSCP